jgi:MoaA/NifB/PqqE/SkfB family radical SAM enzyme
MPHSQTASPDLCETLPPGRVSRIIQIHPSLRCNLCCKHCYSSSAPGEKQGLELAPLLDLIEQAAPLGYNVVSFSGGEPFLYPHLGPLAEAAKQLGYYTSVTTNAMLLPAASKRALLPLFDLVAVSIDGRETEHNLLRNNPNAYNKMLAGLDSIKSAGRDFGFIHTALPGSWRLLSWLVGFALEHKARLLHIHPLERTGRATGSLADIHFMPGDLHKLYIAAHYLMAHAAPDLFIQLDLLHRDNIIGNRKFHTPHLFDELIIDENGDILPIAHGCSPFFRLGNIHEGRPLQEQIENFAAAKLPHLQELYRRTHDEIAADETLEIVNWSERLLDNTHRVRPALLAEHS